MSQSFEQRLNQILPRITDELGNYLITNTYTKLGYLKHRNPDPQAEIKAIEAGQRVRLQ